MIAFRLAALLALCATAPAFAQPTDAPAGSAADAPSQPVTETGRGQRGAEMRAKLQAADSNKDGKWDQAEWIAAGRRERGFTMLDADKDGFVTNEELRAMAGKRRGRAAAP